MTWGLSIEWGHSDRPVELSLSWIFKKTKNTVTDDIQCARTALPLIQRLRKYQQQYWHHPMPPSISNVTVGTEKAVELERPEGRKLHKKIGKTPTVTSQVDNMHLVVGVAKARRGYQGTRDGEVCLLWCDGQQTHKKGKVWDLQGTPSCTFSVKTETKGISDPRFLFLK